jgi:hypothetical protein
MCTSWLRVHGHVLVTFARADNDRVTSDNQLDVRLARPQAANDPDSLLS